MGISFHKIKSNLDVRPLLLSLDKNTELWKEFTARQTTEGSPHSDTESILLRWTSKSNLEAIFTDIEAVDFPALDKLPKARSLINRFHKIVGPEKVGRAMIVKLKPGGTIKPHPDEGEYADHYERFHIPLISEQGNMFCVQNTEDEGEFVHMKQGDLWNFNHKKVHWAVNDSNKPRLHLIIDAVAPAFRKERNEV